DSLEFLDNFFHLELVFYDNTHFQILILLELGMYYKILLEVIETNDCLLVQVKLPLYFSLVIQVAEHLYYILLLIRSEEHTSELQSRFDLVCRLLLEKKKDLTLH